MRGWGKRGGGERVCSQSVKCRMYQHFAFDQSPTYLHLAKHHTLFVYVHNRQDYFAPSATTITTSSSTPSTTTSTAAETATTGTPGKTASIRCPEGMKVLTTRSGEACGFAPGLHSKSKSSCPEGQTLKWNDGRYECRTLNLLSGRV